MNRVAIVQARLASSRLPEKVLLPLAGKPVIVHLLEGLSRCGRLDEVVVAIPEEEQGSRLDQLLGELSVKVVYGPNEDVLKRFVYAAYDTGAEIIVRVTADNPLTWPEGIDLEVAYLEEHPEVDYVRMSALPLGTMAEALTRKALERMDQLVKEPRYREHVTSYIAEEGMSYAPSRGFIAHDLEVPEELSHPELRLTLDTDQDYKLLSRIYERLYQDGEPVGLQAVVELLISEPELREINQDVVQIRA